MRSAALVLALVLGACASGGEPRIAAERPPSPALYADVPAGHTAWSNASLARLFATLTLETEWGGAQTRLLRLEAPVRVALSGPGSAQYSAFTEEYLAYLRRHAGIDIRSEAPAGRPTNLFVRFVPSGAFERLLPEASCALVPGDTTWSAFQAAPAKRGGDAMIEADALSAVSVFIPDSARPADIRRCLLEEIAQALGPHNDLYGLGPSIFNDDFGHLWPTKLDLLMLRVLYAPEMRSGLGRRETEQSAQKALDRLNPEGRGAPPLPDPKRMVPDGWRKLIARTVRRGDPEGRVNAARDALALARAGPPRSPALCHSLRTLATLLRKPDPERSERLFAEAERLCTAVHGADDPRLATLALLRAGLALSRGKPARALALGQDLETALAAHGLDEALASHYAIREKALHAVGRPAEATAAAKLAKAWGSYAFGRPGKPN